MASKIGEVHETENGFEWRINNFLDLCGENEMYDSPSYSYNGVYWTLKIYPNGRTSRDTVGYLDMFLIKEYSKSLDIDAFSIAVKTVNKGKVLERHWVKDWGRCLEFHEILQYIPKSELVRRKAELVPSGVLTVVITFQSPTDISEKLMHDFERMLSGDHSDIIVKVKEEEFRLHKVILAARNPYFYSMFNSDMIEKSTGVVEIEDCEPDIFRYFINFLYAGKLDKLSPENVCDLYRVADKYQEDQLKRKCLYLMLKTLSVQSFCDYYVLALMYDEKDLFEKSFEFFMYKQQEITCSEKWQVFVKEYPIQANELFDRCS